MYKKYHFRSFIIKQSDPDPYQIEKHDPDPDQSEKLDLYQKGLDPPHCAEVWGTNYSSFSQNFLEPERLLEVKFEHACISFPLMRNVMAYADICT